MKVKCFDSTQKDQIALAYIHKTLNLKELAKHFNTSSRTIGRVLEERGLATPVPRLKGEAYHAMQVLKDCDVQVLDLYSILAARDVPRISKETCDVMEILACYSMGAAELLTTLALPVLTPANIQTYLNQCSKQDLATHFYTSGLTKLAEIAQQVHANKPQEIQAVPV